MMFWAAVAVGTLIGLAIGQEYFYRRRRRRMDEALRRWAERFEGRE